MAENKNTVVLESNREKSVFGPEVSKQAEKQVQTVRQNLKVAQS
jgi:hypothetical protein